MITLGSAKLSLQHIEKLLYDKDRVEIDQTMLQKIERCYQLIQKRAGSETPLYGINTGFGALAEQKIGEGDQTKLQRNIILSHAVGVGEPLKPHEARTMMLLRLNTLAQGYSGASPSLLHSLTELVNADIAPFVPQKGSVGASGDLAPLAHLGLLLLGIGEAFIGEERVSARDALKKAGLRPINLGIRDGLALINGTQAMGAKGMIALIDANLLLKLADIAGAVSLSAVGGHMAPFDERIQAVKPHPGQGMTAKNIRALCAGRQMHGFTNTRTQDPYSLRCIPQVHGASKDAVFQMSVVIEREINGVTDNPLIFVDETSDTLTVLSGGNFHGQSLALALDYMAMAMAELANIAERRIEQLLNPHYNNGLPPFLAPSSGLNSGYMLLQVTASALVNENKVLCHPASVDSIPTSANREDHVSMGMTSANKLSIVLENTRTVLAIELMAAMQGLGFRAEDWAGVRVQQLSHALRAHIPFRYEDGLYYEDLQKLLAWLARPQTRLLFAQILST